MPTLSLLKGRAVAVIDIHPIPTVRQQFAPCERCGLRRWLGERVTERWISEGRAPVRERLLYRECATAAYRREAEFRD